MLEFPPPRRGLVLHAVLILVLAVLCVAGITLATRQPIGLGFTIYILISALTFFPLPFLVYRLYALGRANYRLDRDKLTLTWGLRMEKIPVPDVEWVRPVSDLNPPLPLPILRLPGSVLGTRQHTDLGPVEFLASDAKSLLAIATARRVFVISPEDASGFVQNMQRAIEMGSLTPTAARSVYPTFVIPLAWESLLARYLWLSGLLMNAGLIAWVSLTIPTLQRVSLGFMASGEPRPVVPGAGLILLPILSVATYSLSWVLGLFYYRRPDQHALAYVLWASGVMSSLLFLFAVLFILITPV